MAEETIQDKMRRLPGVDALLQTEAIQEALSREPRSLVLESIRQVLDTTRKRLLESKEEVEIDRARLVEQILDRLEKISGFTLRTVINASGIVIHTNLGRSLLASEAIERLNAVCGSYSNLEYDLEEGRRGSRYVHAEAVLRELTGAEAALVVNNNAAAVFLVLNTLAKDREVVVSRGQLVEIGGSFRIPDVMRSSGAILREVGCTNRTHPHDYASAINEQTGLLMKVHTSNYKIVGFSSEVSLEEMVELGKDRGIPVVEDLGSGSFVDFSRFGLQGEPTVQDAIRMGADIVTFSGDKLLGGPQAGIILGRKDLVARCRKNPLTRALRVDKMTLATLEATLRLYRDERTVLEKIPTLRMVSVSQEMLLERARHLASLIGETDAGQQLHIEVRPGFSQVGGGSLPAQDLPTHVVAVTSARMSANRMETRLRNNDPPIIGRIESDQYLLDVRTLQEQDLAVVQEAFRRLVTSMDRSPRE